MANPDPFDAMRALTAAQPAPAPRDRESELAAEKKAREAAAYRSPEQIMRESLPVFVDICAQLVATDKCPFSWDICPLAALRSKGANNVEYFNYFKSQLQARGLRFVNCLDESYVEICEPNSTIPTPNVPDWLTVAAHQNAVQAWKARASEPFIQKFVANAALGKNTNDIVCTRQEQKLAGYMNEKFAQMPFSNNGVRSIIKVYCRAHEWPGICGELVTRTMSAQIEDATFLK
jgi:hypothetical protein